MKNIGIMGGSFDPPHIGHLAIAKWVYKELDLEEIWFVPTGKVYYKNSLKGASAEDRVNMVKLAIADEPAFLVKTIEAEKDEFSYTYMTLERLKEENPDTCFTFIVGADSLAYMDSWREPKRIFELCRVATVNREGYSIEELEEKKKFLSEKFGADIIILNMPSVNVSSTLVRTKWGETGKTEDYISPRVAEYIEKNGLYQEK